MKKLTNPSHFSFTNHFNQSLLKSRISMMNKTRSTWKTFGKYLLLVPVFFVVFSFSKPYVVADAQTKYLVQTDDAVEWVITPKIKMADLVKIQDAVESKGGTFEITSYQLDPLKLYVQRLTCHQRASRSSETANYGITHSFRPIRCSFYKFDLKTNRIDRYEKGLPSGSLKEVAIEDRTEAEKAFQANGLEYELREIQEQYGTFWDNIHYLTTSTFSEPQPTFYRVLAGKSSSVWKDKLSGEEILKIGLKHTAAVTRINRRPVAHEDLAKLDAKTIKDTFIFDIYDEKNNYAKKTYVLVHTTP